MKYRFCSLLLAGFLLGGTNPAEADDCYYYWVHQCLNVIDASQRKIEQYVLVSPSVNYLNSGNLRCAEAVAQRQHDVHDALLTAFNGAAGNIDACDTPLTEIPVRVYDNPQKATWHYGRSLRESPGKTIVPLADLPAL